ncbi:MAG: HpcH/HpaI aldolase/citrate lyase family protein [Clostridia bacterium]
MIRENKVKKMIKEGKTALGTFVKITDPASMEVLCMSGLDFVIVDNEHTSMSKETMVNLVRASEIYDVPCIIRVRESDPNQILQALDSGALGVQVPAINTVADAKSAAMSSKYKPEGNRGYTASQRAAGYGIIPPAEYAMKANENIMTICYCETKEALDNLDEMVKIEGIDVIFIGPYDLSQALGVTGNPSHDIVQKAIEVIIEKTTKSGKQVGILAADGEQAKYYNQKGINFIVMNSDTSMIYKGVRQYISQFKG